MHKPIREHLVVFCILVESQQHSL